MKALSCAVLVLLPLMAPSVAAAIAGRDPGDPIDLTSAVSGAMEVNPRVRALRLRYEAMLDRPEQESALPDPMLSYGFMFEDVVTTNGPITGVLEISQEIPFHRKRPLRGGISRLEAEAAESAWRAARLDVALEVRAAYYDLFRIDRSLEIVAEEADLLDRLEQVARARYAAGLAGQGDVLRAQTEHSLIEERLLLLRRDREGVAASFNALLDRDAGAAVGPALDPPDPAIVLPGDEALYEAARAARPEITEAKSLVEAGTLRERLMRRDYLPDFRVGVQWNRVDETANPFAPDPGQDGYMLTLGVSVPIWRGRLRAGVREAEAMTESARSEVLDRTNRATSEVRAILAAVRAQRGLATLYASTLVPQAESTLEAAEAAYQAGTSDFLGVLDSERRLLELKLSHVEALAELGGTLAALERAVGLDLETIAAVPGPEASGGASQ